jgi:acetyl esterase/lipase
MGDSAGALVLLSAFQCLNKDEQNRIKRISLISPWLDFSLSNPDMEGIEKNDFILSINQFKGLDLYDDILDSKRFVSPMEFTYQKPIDIYVGTYDILYPDTCIFENRNKDVNLMIFEKHPHVFALLPMKKSKIVINHIIKTINDVSYK